MSRPLIIKIENRATSPSRINRPAPMVVRSKSELVSAMVQTNGLVRSLINLYESSPSGGGRSNMVKAKSLQNLDGPEPGIESFDFRRATDTVKADDVQNGIEERAGQLLKQYNRGVEDKLWSERVVQLLKDICRDENVVEESSTADDHAKSQRVRDIASLYEVKVGNGPITVKPNFAKYFTSPPPPNPPVENKLSLSSCSESDLSADGQPNSNSVNINELKSYFESGNGERLAPPPKMGLSEEGQSSMQRIAPLIAKIEKQQKRIEALSKEDYEEGPKINEELIQALIKLDEVPTLGDVVLQGERKKAILLVQASIRQLMHKRRP